MLTAMESSDSRRDLAEGVSRCLRISGITECNSGNVDRIVTEIRKSLAWRKKWQRQLGATESLGAMDIIRWIALAREAGDPDEAIWRGLLAGHFGRPSANPSHPSEVESAGRFLCGFTEEPMWTWNAVSSDFGRLTRWLGNHQTDLTTLNFGNHRKYESKQPAELGRVISGLVAWVHRTGGAPAAALGTDRVAETDDEFARLFGSLSQVYRFGRTGSFDTLVLLADMGLFPARPRSCYLQRPTGPLRGASELFGQRPPRELERMADNLARCMSLPFEVTEDMLCNFQKRGKG